MLIRITVSLLLVEVVLTALTEIIMMPKLKSMTPSQSIKNGSFETWLLIVLSIVKVVGAELALPHKGTQVVSMSLLQVRHLATNSKERVSRKMRIMI